MTSTKIEELLQQSTTIQENLTTILAKLHDPGNEPKAKDKAVHGLHFDKFNEELEPFDDYLDRLTCFLNLQNVPEEKKVNTLITVLSPKLYSLLKSLLYPATYSDKSFKELTDLLRTHLSPKPLIIPSRHAFLNRKQLEGESISQYVAQLRKLVVHCQYDESMLNIMLRDAFVSGLHNKSMLDRLFEEDNPDFKKTVEIALAMERATLGTSEILQNPIKQVNQVSLQANQKKRGGKPSNKSRSNQGQGRPTGLNTFNSNKTQLQCMRCAKMGHKAPDCFVKNLFCTNCQKPGYVLEVCLRRKNSSQTSNNNTGNKSFKTRPIKQVGLGPNDSREINHLRVEETLQLYNVSLASDTNARPPIMVDLCIDNNPLTFELDTGSAATVISLDKFQAVTGRSLKPTSVKFKSYNNEIIHPLGEATVDVQYKNQKKSLTLYVVEENLSSIVGRDWLYNFQLDWKDIKALQVYNTDSKVKSKLTNLLTEYKSVFEKNVGTINNFVCDLKLKHDAKPCFSKARPVPLAIQKRVELELIRLEREGIIKQVETSDWASPVVPVVKPDETIRLCADYSGTVNKQIEVPQHPLPRYEDVFSKLSGGLHFTTLDILSAFLHMPVSEKTSEILTINTHKGLYRCLRLMYGVSAAPATWQKYIESVLANIPNCTVVHDDIILTARTDDEHLLTLRTVLGKLKSCGLHLNIDKCKFFQDEVTYLGHKINSAGISKTSDKIQAVLEFKPPSSVKEVKSFLGMVSFYGRFFPNLSTLANPLYNLTKSHVPFKWTRECENSFQAIKKEIVSDRILVHYNPELPVILAVDASPVGLGAVLSHQMPDGSERPIAFGSRTLTGSECNYSQIDKEALAIKWGIQKFYHYLYGRKFTLVTDHQPLIHIFGSRNKLPVLQATRLLHYALFLQTFQFEIKYRKSELHGNADCLSRFPTKSSELFAMDDVSLFHIKQLEQISSTIGPEQLARATTEDEDLKVILQNLQTGVPLQGKEGIMSLQSGCVMYGSRVYIPAKFRQKVLEELHLGHLGIVKMKALSRSYVYWPRIDSDIEALARNCPKCVLIQRQPSKGDTHFWEYPSHPWERLHIDFAGPFFGHTFLLVVDAHSKWPEIFLMNSTTSSATIAKLSDLFASYGFPKVLVSDNAATFTSIEFQQFLKLRGIKHITGAPFHAASNGQAERYVHTLKQSLRAMKTEHTSMQDNLNAFLLAYRRAPNATTGQSPALLFLKRELRSALEILRPNLQDTVAKHTRGDKFSLRNRSFVEGQKVAVRNYTSPNKKWLVGTVLSRDGELNYTISVNNNLWRRHADQIRSVGSSIPESLEPNPVLLRIPDRTTTRPTESSPVSPVMSQASTGSPQRGGTPRNSPSTANPATSRPTEGTQEVEATQTPQIRRSSRIRKPPQRMNL